jgi:hypothetical protein
MFEADNIRDWRDHDVVDPDGNKIGQLEAIYVDTATDQRVFASVASDVVNRRISSTELITWPGQES